MWKLNWPKTVSVNIIRISTEPEATIFIRVCSSYRAGQLIIVLIKISLILILAGRTMDEITERILSHFSEVSSIPRCSKNEEKIAIWLKEWALYHGFSVKFDAVNNIRDRSSGFKRM